MLKYGNCPQTMVVDDREHSTDHPAPPELIAPSDTGLVICGSANINERSQRGDRDSELVAVIRDTDMIDRLVSSVLCQYLLQ